VGGLTSECDQGLVSCFSAFILINTAHWMVCRTGQGRFLDDHTPPTILSGFCD